ncbi:MAG: RNA polymerase sporulation sigma factor SigK [Clostridia bacterium]|nr:RNA polymerase sporulation sigma factor SigK [Clostridia bacterium]
MFFDFLSLLFSKIFFFTGAVQNGKGSFPRPLTPEEEKKYLALARQGDKEAKNILVKHNMRLVAHIAKKYSGAAESDDLLSVGSIGLIKAINTYQEGKGTRLATYTARCIENEILMLIRAGKKHKNNVSLSEPVGVDKEGNELTLIDLLAEKEDSVYSQVEKSIQRDKFVKLLKEILTEREYTIISMRYGLQGGSPVPQREVAKALGISRSYISRIEKRAIEKAREQLNKDDFFTD